MCRTGLCRFGIKNWIFLLVSVQLFTYAQGGDSSPDYGVRWSTEPGDAVAAVGERVSLPCAAASRHALRLAWRHDAHGTPTRDHTISPHDKHRKQLPNGTLVIESMTPELAGHYQCVATVDNIGTIVSRDAVLFLAEVPAVLAGPRSLLVGAGGAALLPCPLQSTPRVALRPAPAADRRVYAANKPSPAPPTLKLNVTWLKNGSPVSLEAARVSLTPSGALEIDPLQPHDAAKYRCRVALYNRPEEYKLGEEMELVVGGLSGESPPRLVVAPRPLTVVEGASLTFDCAAAGNPQPHITWLNNGVAIDLNDLDSRLYLAGGGSLRVQWARAPDAGSYTCRAHSRLDSTDHTTQLHVMSVPRVSCSGGGSGGGEGGGGGGVVFARERGEVTLRCAARGRPAPRTRWLKDGDPLTPNNHDIAILDGSSLRIQGVLRVDSGMFQCVGESPAGSATDSLRLLVLPPEDAPPHRNLTDVASGSVIPDAEDEPLESDFLGETSSAYTSPPPCNECSPAQGAALNASVAPPRALAAPIVKHRFVTLSWQPPDPPDPPARVLAYELTYRVVGSERERVFRCPGEKHELNVAGLQPNTTYQFTLATITDAGASPPTPPLSVRTAEEEVWYGAVGGVRVEGAGPHALRVAWAPPAALNQSLPPPDKYTIHYTEVESGREQFQLVEVEPGTLAPSAVVSGLRGGAAYSVRVSAAGAAPSPAAAARTPPAPPPGAPRNVTAAPTGASSVLVRWEPAGARAQLTGYKLRYRAHRRKPDTLATPADTARAHITDLEPATTYQVRVAAMNAAGTGPFSEWVSVTTHARDRDETSVPPQPPPLNSRAGRDWISVWWAEEAGGAARGVAVRGYLLGWGLGVPDEMSRELPAHTHSYVIRNLAANSEYVISLRASNSRGLGPAVYTSVRTRAADDHTDLELDPDLELEPGDDLDQREDEPAPLIPPVGVKAIMLSGTTAVVYWTDPTLPKGQSVADGRRYVVRWAAVGGAGGGARAGEGGGVTDRPRYFNATDLNCMIDDLKPFTHYEFSVKLIKGGRSSPWSMVVWNTSLEAAPGSAPRELRAAPAPPPHRAVELHWAPPARPNGLITGYVVMYAVSGAAGAGAGGAGGEEWTAVGVAGERGRARLDRLRPRTQYSIKVQARNGKGLGPFSPTITYTTAIESGGGGGLASATSAWLWASAGGACAVLALAAALALSLCCRRNHAPLSPDTSTYQKSSASAAIKPPDLWIHHDQMELKHMDKGLHASASKISAGSAEGGAVSSLSLSRGAEYEPARHNAPPPASLDRRHYVPTYVDCVGTSSCGSDDTCVLRDTCSCTQYAMTGMGVGVGCSSTCDRRPHRPMHPDQSTPLLGGVSLGSPQSSVASLAPHATHPTHPAHPQHPPPCMSTGVGGCGVVGGVVGGPGGCGGVGGGLGGCGGVGGVVGGGVGGGCGDIYACAARERGHYVAYEPLGHYTHRESLSSEAGAHEAAGSLPRRAAAGGALHSFTLSDNASEHSTPTHTHSRGSARDTSPYKKSASSSPGHIPNRLQLGCGVASSGEELEPLTPSRSTERLHREMQNLEGLMKDLSAITQHQFHC